MKNYIGIDLGTTNSAIVSFDGEKTHIYKSPEQNDVTPSAIFIDKRGNKYFGKTAYDKIAWDPGNVAVRFKRLLGSNTTLKFQSTGKSMLPEECSAEILKLLYNYLPEDIRKQKDIGVVITVPAVFDQMKKEATLSAAKMAGIGKVAFLQEPVATIMSVMKTRPEDGIFLIYDIGGGTLDITIAESINKHVDLRSLGGIEFCGGRDFDRLILENVVYPWLEDKFDLPDDFLKTDKYKKLEGLSAFATERAKIGLSSKENEIISLSEDEVKLDDESGEEIYLDISIDRQKLNDLIEEQLNETINAAKEVMAEAGYKSEDINRIVFVGGPTMYKPLRDKISAALQIPTNTDVNPMTGVAEGAAIFAESIDWASVKQNQKNTRGKLKTQGPLKVDFDYIARTPDSKTKLKVQLHKKLDAEYEIQIDSLDSGWKSGRIALRDGLIVDLILSKPGANQFKIFLFSQFGEPMPIDPSTIVVEQTVGTVDSIPASHTVSLGVLDKLGGTPVLDILVQKGDSLPKTGKKLLKAAETIKSGSYDALTFYLWEGTISHPIDDNRFIGTFKILGNDFDDGVIHAGADIELSYEMGSDGNIRLQISIPSIRGTFDSEKNFYSRQEGQKDFTIDADIVLDDVMRTRERAEEMAEKINDPDLDSVINKLDDMSNMTTNDDVEKVKETNEKVLQAKKDIDKLRKKHLQTTRQMELDYVVNLFKSLDSRDVTPSEKSSFENLVNSAKRVLSRNDNEFENYVDELHGKLWSILWKLDWFVIDKFKHQASTPHMFNDRNKFEILVKQGEKAIQNDDIKKLKEILYEMSRIRIYVGDDVSGDLKSINIIKG
jgi:molecular chaperone DnaK